MALLEKIRVKLGVFISVVIALALLSFIIDPGTLQSVSATMSSKYDVGKINGKSVSYNEFQKDVEEFTTINEMLTGSAVHSEQQQEMIRNSVWQSLIDKYMFYHNAKAAGINVGDAELLNLTTGDMVSPMIAQIFRDESGNFSLDVLRQFTQSVESDPSGNMLNLWNYLQTSVYTQQLYAKYGSLFTQSDYTNPLMLAKEIEWNNNTTDVEFVMVPFGYAQDTTITVSDKEIKAYYKSHKHLYEQPASRDIEYVVFEVEPSEQDIAETTSQTDELHNEFIDTDNVKSFLLRNSDRQYSEYWYRTGELNTVSTDVNDFVFGKDGKKGSTSPLFRKGNTFYAAKVMDERQVPDSVYVRHILLQGDDEALADSLVTVLEKGSDSFSNIAAMYSADQNTNVPERGDIGWMTQTYMIPGMESVMTARVGDIFTIDTDYGKHIVEVTQRTEPVNKKQVAIFEKAIIPSKATYNEFYSKANTLATKAAGKYEDFKVAVSEEGLYAHPVNRMLESSSRLGSIDDTKEVTRWVFEAKKGKASNVITVNNDYFFVVAVKDVHKEGTATVQEMASTIRNIIYNRKLGEKKTAEVAEKINGLGSMQAIAEALGTTVSNSDNVTFASLTSQGLDPKFIGAVSKVKSHDTGAFYTEDDAKTRDAQMAQYSSQMLLPVMMQDADVKDNRARFY